MLRWMAARITNQTMPINSDCLGACLITILLVYVLPIWVFIAFVITPVTEEGFPLPVATYEQQQFECTARKRDDSKIWWCLDERSNDSFSVSGFNGVEHSQCIRCSRFWLGQPLSEIPTDCIAINTTLARMPDDGTTDATFEKRCIEHWESRNISFDGLIILPGYFSSRRRKKRIKEMEESMTVFSYVGTPVLTLPLVLPVVFTKEIYRNVWPSVQALYHRWRQARHQARVQPIDAAVPL